jgi:hypothetical protein
MNKKFLKTNIEAMGQKKSFFFREGFFYAG